MDSSDGKIPIVRYPKANISLDKEIGSGSFGNVYRASIRDSKYPVVAVKIFLKEMRSSLSKQKKKAYDELNKVAMLEHENVVKLIGMVDEEMPWLIFEFMRDGNLLEYVLKKKDPKEKTLVRFARDISNGMAYLHHNKILHKDLAARNILLDGKRAKIADLGLSSILSEEDAGSYALGGKLFPYRHAAVECIVEEIYTFESDVWAFGVLLWEMWTGGRTPYGRENKQPEVRRFVVEGRNPTDFLKPNCHQNINMMFKSIFQLKRENRPMFEDITPVFESILHGGKIQMPVIRSREPSPFRKPNPPPPPPRSRSNSDEKVLDPKSTVSKRSHLHPQLSGDSPVLNNVLTVRATSPLSTSTPNLHAPEPFNSVRIPSRTRTQRQRGIENSHVGSPPSILYQQYTPPPNSSDFGGRKLSGDLQIKGTIGKATSLSNLEASKRFGSGVLENPHGSQTKLDLNGFIPNRFGRKT